VPDLVEVGRVGKPHGLGGRFFVEQASEDPERFHIGAELVVAGTAARIVESTRVRGRRVIRLDRRVERGAALEVPRSALGPTAEGEYFVFQLVGLAVEEEGGRELGRVVDVQPGLANDVLELDSGLLLPMVEDCVRDVDLEQERMLIARGFAEAG